MPTCEYERDNCGHRFEKRQRISDQPIKTRPKCGQPVRRLIGAGAGLIFKSSGFYATDYRSSNGSLPWQPQVRAELALTDAIMPSVDTGDGSLLRFVNRTHPKSRSSDL